jgi:ABC-type spermidine/putrescine transport system permease subunit II
VLPIVGWVLAPIILATSTHFGNVSTTSGLQRSNNAGVIAFFIAAGVEGLLGIVGIILALSARRQIRSSGGNQTGEGLAVAGLVLSSIVIVAGVLALAVAVFLYSLDKQLTF